MDSISEILPTAFLVFFGISFFIALWFGILTLTSLMSGWNRLSKKYPFTEKHRPPDKTKTFQTAQIGISSYNNVLTFSFYSEGLAVEVMVLFRFKHPKLFIPWNDMKLKEKSKSIFSWNKMEIGSPPVATISINDKNLA